MEIYKVIEEFPDYEVSNLGNVRNITTDKVLKPCLNSRGYFHVTLHNKGIQASKRIHRLVAKAFIQNPLGCDIVDHIDRNPKNNTMTNLRWVNQSDNLHNTTKRSWNQSGYKHVYRNKGAWLLQIKYKKKRIHVGRFTDDELPYGICLMDAMLIDYFGDYAVLNGEH